MDYVVVSVKTGNGYGAYVPDLPGCIAAGDTREETEALIREAVAYHLEMLREHGDPVPEPQASASLAPRDPAPTGSRIPRRSSRRATMKLTYAVVFEQTPNNYCAYVPDVPGCVGAADTPEEMQAMIREALAFHIEDLLEQGEPLPEPKMSIEDAIACHNEPIPEDVLESYAEYGEDTPTLSTRFEFVAVEVPAPHAARAS